MKIKTVKKKGKKEPTQGTITETDAHSGRHLEWLALADIQGEADNIQGEEGNDRACGREQAALVSVED